MRRSLLAGLLAAALLAAPAAAAPPPDPGNARPVVAAWMGAWDRLPPARPVLLLPVALRVAWERLAQAPLAGYVAVLEDLRGRRFEHPVPWSVKTPDQVRQFMRHVLDRDYPRERSDFDATALAHLGLVPSDFGLRAFLVDLYGQQVQGAYDPEDGHFFVVRQRRNWLERALTAGGPSQDDLVAVHELDHALQDQLFDLKAMQKRVLTPRSSDREMALAALIEGDATLVMFEHMFRSQGRSVEEMQDMTLLAGLMDYLPGAGGLGDAPLYFRRALIFPYFMGMELVRSVHRTGGWRLVDRMYEDPPTSTEQVLHPESYLLDRDDPLEVRLQGLPLDLGGWKAAGEDTGGEFLVRVFLEHHGAADPEWAAAGWGGDRMRVYRQGSRSFLVWVTLWDDEEEAVEFENSSREVLRGSRWALWRTGRRVALAVSAPPDLLPALRQGVAGTTARVARSPRKVLAVPD